MCNNKYLPGYGKHENELVTRLVNYLQKRGDCTLYGHLDGSKRVGTLSFSHPLTIHPISGQSLIPVSTSLFAPACIVHLTFIVPSAPLLKDCPHQSWHFQHR